MTLRMSRSSGGDQFASGLPLKVVERIHAELGDRGIKVVAALRTAAEMLAWALRDESGLRLAESAMYNVREAFDGVVASQQAVVGGAAAALAALNRFEDEVRQPGNDDVASLEELKVALRRDLERRERTSYHASKLLGYLQRKAGIGPLAGPFDPVAEYNRLRGRAAGALHTSTALADATDLYERALAWFVRMFTPPDAVVTAVRELAAEAWQGEEQIERLRLLASNPHHLRLFFTGLRDPAWLLPLHAAGVITPPEQGASWPLTGLLEHFAQAHPADLAALLKLVFVDVKQLSDPAQKSEAGFEVIRMATQLGAPADALVGDIYSALPGDRNIRALAVDAVKRSDPADDIVLRVGRLVLNGSPFDTDRYYYKVVLDQLLAGVDADNLSGRLGMLVAKVRAAAEHEQAKYVALDIARFTTPLGEQERHYLVVITHYLSRLLAKVVELGLDPAVLLTKVRTIPGKIGGRLASQLLVRADEVALRDKISHIADRLTSSTASGEDQDLVVAILSLEPSPEDLAVWGEALGTPSEAQGGEVPRDWARTWRWSSVLPAESLAAWGEQIAAVTARYGEPERTFENRMPQVSGRWAESPRSAEHLRTLPVLAAAALVAEWRPGADTFASTGGALELARALQVVIEAETEQWAADPVEVVRTLREPTYVQHYFSGLTKKAADLSDRTAAIVEAARLVRTERWTPSTLADNNFDYEADWNAVEVAFVDLIAALANTDAPLRDQLDDLWEWADDLLDRQPPPAGDSGGDRDALNRAINSRSGHGLQAILALAAWEHRNNRGVRARFEDILDPLLAVRGSVGMEFRAVLSMRRVLLERIAHEWLEANVEALFRDPELGAETFVLTLKYSGRATPWFFHTFRDDLFDAARRGVTEAVDWIAIGATQGEEGYGVASIISSFRGNGELLAQTTEDIAFRVQNLTGDAPELAVGVEFWQALLDAKRVHAPAEALHSVGRWAFVAGLGDDVWSRLMVETLKITDGVVDYVIEVADRCESTPVPGDSTRILLMLLGKGEPWEQHYVAGIASQALAALSETRPDENFAALRTRLLELGRHEVVDLMPYDDSD
ncbi:hypothetical protein [Lentzea sp. NPDC003310]|uniref:hypothetical protein n=1 Tax=Lentzea sp. NPDC003310 TaxID=3154447 RepID=UPI0033A9023E